MHHELQCGVGEAVSEVRGLFIQYFLLSCLFLVFYFVLYNAMYFMLLQHKHFPNGDQ